MKKTYIKPTMGCFPVLLEGAILAESIGVNNGYADSGTEQYSKKNNSDWDMDDNSMSYKWPKARSVWDY